jgi:hypothetical protein
VVDAADPLRTGRVQVSVPSVSGTTASWAPTLRDISGPPAVGDEVLVSFDAGDLARPYVLGAVATGPPRIELADEHGNAVRMGPSGVELTSASAVRVTSSTVHVSTSSGAVDSGMWTFSGVVRSQTLITESVVASSYSPGAGNTM